MDSSCLFSPQNVGMLGGSLTGLITVVMIASTPSAIAPKARQYTDEVLLDLTWQSKLGNSDDSLLTSRVYTDFLNYNFDNPDPNTFGTRDEVNRRAIGVQVQHNWQVAKNQTLTYGADYRNTRSRNTTFSYTTNSTQVNYDGDISQGALFARYEVNFTPSFSVNLGVRQDFNSLVNGSFTSPATWIIYLTNNMSNFPVFLPWDAVFGWVLVPHFN